MRHIHSQKLERWLGPNTQIISDGMRNWYGPPVPVALCDGPVYAAAGGDFIGSMKGGDFMSLADYEFEKTKQAMKRIWDRAGKNHNGQLNAGFASLSDLISEATTGAKRREYVFYKTGSPGVINATNDMWYAAGQPTAGASAGAAPGGTAFTSSSTGAFGFANPTGGDTQHFVNGYACASFAPNTLLMYDRLFGVTKTMNSTATEAVSGSLTRYTNTTSGNADSADGNFLFVVSRTALAATAHNWTTCLYTNSTGTTGRTLPSLTGNASNIINRLDHPVGQWFAPLATNDSGILALTQMQCSAAVASGAIDFVIGHPLAWWPVISANMMFIQDGLNSAFNLSRIFDNAAISFLDVTKSNATATNWTGMFLTVAG